MLSKKNELFKIIMLVVIGVLLVAHVQCVNIKVDPLVYIDQGLVRGQKATDGDYAYFLGIPYAKVDLNNPFGPSKSHPGFGDEIFNAYDGSINCPQPEYYSGKYFGNQNIDCLILNVFVPNSASTTNPLPVLVYIHGGGFNSGSIEEYGVPNVVKEGVIVVLMNYRLGPYGFFCLDTPLAPGNQGLKDQYEALRWVRKNIVAFGGNPYNVTLGGLSAGSRSALFHLYSPHDKLFNKIIAQSAAGLEKSDEGDHYAIATAGYLGFNTSDTERALEFLASTSHDLVIGAVTNLGLDLRPCMERSFSGIENIITNEAYPLSNEEKVKNTPILIGRTNREYKTYSNTIDDSCQNNIFYCTLAYHFNMDENQIQVIGDIIMHYYLGDQSLSSGAEEELAAFMSDFRYNHGVQRVIDSLLSEKASPIFEYVFSYGESGASHSDDWLYLFQNNYDNEEQQTLSNRLVSLWANFVKYGNPTPQVTELLPVIWEPASEDNRPYLDINSDISLGHRFHDESMAFWDLFYKAYGKYHKLARSCQISKRNTENI